MVVLGHHHHDPLHSYLAHGSKSYIALGARLAHSDTTSIPQHLLWLLWQAESFGPYLVTSCISYAGAGVAVTSYVEGRARTQNIPNLFTLVFAVCCASVNAGMFTILLQTTAVMAFLKRQESVILVSSVCYVFASEAQLLRAKAILMWNRPGSFSSAFCASYASAGLTPVLRVLSCPVSQCSGNSCTWSAAKSRTASSASSASGASPIYPPTPTSTLAVSSSAADAGITTAAIAGIAVGSVVAIIILPVIIFFLRRYGQNRKRHLIAAAATSENQGLTDEAQLHSDEYKPPREELEVSRAPPKLRTIGGLHEIEYHDLAVARSELSANEVAASELRDGTLNTQATGSPKLGGSSSRGAEP